ncbi:hypothetical protein OG245_03705 [Streptomyces sp. NBC_01116]|uniref:hypothetical protein n=1 Tax=Streptomyces sp. NBC_01116 TaxID=2903752 RepID=UPI00324D25F1
MSLTAPLRGVVPPVCTPLDDRGEVDTASLMLGVIDRGATAFPQIPLSEASVASVAERLRGAGLPPVR